MSPSPDAPAAWQVLFDGTTVRGLHAYGGGDLAAARWEVVEGRLRTLPGVGRDLATDLAFGDLELEFGWGVEPGGNSGVMVRVAEGPDPPWWSGPEYQLLDDARHPDGRDPHTSTGALYGLLAPTVPTRVAPAGGENASRIVVRDGTVEHWLAGERILTYRLDDPALAELVAASKFADAPDFLRVARGAVVFQHHGEVAWFTSIRIRALDAGSGAADAPG